MNDLEAAIDMALNAHAGDTDKAGETYIRHPLRVMEQMETEQERIVAILHDVVEDSEYHLTEIEERFGPDIRDAVAALTKPDGVDYLEDYIPQLATNPIARSVKRADLKDNLDVTRLNNITQDDLENIQKYHQALQHINAAAEGQS